MPFGFQKSQRFGWKYLHYRINASRTGISHTVKVGPVSMNSRTRMVRIDGPGPLFWRSRRRR